MLMFSRKIFRLRVLNYKICGKRNKYIVLLPEIPSDTAENNPLLRNNVVPPFSELTTEKCINAIGKLVIEYESGIHYMDQKLYDSEIERNIQNIILPLDKLSGSLDFGWGAFKILYTVRRNDSIADAYIKLHPRIIKAKREKYLSTSIYQAFKELKEKEKQFTEPVQRIINKHLLESRLSGMDLSDNSYKHFQSVMQKLDKHRKNYKAKLLESSSKFSQNLEFNDVRNFPRELLKLLAFDPTNISKGPWALTLNPHIYRYFLKHCDDRMLRWNAYYAYNIRASQTSGPELNNSIEIEEIRHQRSELAQVLGFKNFAELSMKTKMAGKVENVLEMITTLHVKSKQATLKEIEELQVFANRNGFQHNLEMWDIPYWQRVHKEDLFSIDDDVVRQYFPLPSVLEGLFNFCHNLFEITIKENPEKVDTWHEDVKFYKIYDSSDKEMASFFIDPYSRSGEKIPGSWIDVGRNRSDVIGSDPLAYLIFNFPPPSFGKPSLLSFDDLKILMKKFGHLLQHSLTTVPYNEVAGLTNLEWDVVNVCPFVMNSFLKHYKTFSSLSKHVDSGKQISPELHDQLIKRDLYMSGLRLTEELYLSALDLEMYTSKDFWRNISKRVWSEYMPFTYEKDSAQPCSFSEIFSDQYPAAYFSNLWAEMIAADVFNAFEEAGLDNEKDLQKISHRFRDTFLSLGGGCHPSEVFRKFRGRDPSTDALVASLGLVTKTHN
ncbi:probable cytosolic oligopeptidase A [Trichonephila clavata]|uniref:oligopeptidase A n=1 Tax=Trichonephila clavata TaxID=2740835 RepID=A0A8X6KZT1_TRICU|nr:probable cytosolic oligopeptidase A [Trichonephila clavata]